MNLGVSVDLSAGRLHQQYMRVTLDSATQVKGDFGFLCFSIVKNTSLRIITIKPGSVAHVEEVIKCGDKIIAVNGSTSVKDMLDRIRNETRIEIVIQPSKKRSSYQKYDAIGLRMYGGTSEKISENVDDENDYIVL